MNYVVGFIFSSDRNKVALIEKLKPEWQAGKLNGVGGKIEASDESPLDAMVREFEEETGALIAEWRHFCTLSFRGGYVYFFEHTEWPGELAGTNSVTSMTDEQVGWYDVANIPENAIPNLRWLIPMALDKDQVTATVEDKS
jgi:8-oxo-dGTP diphosphatase